MVLNFVSKFLCNFKTKKLKLKMNLSSTTLSTSTPNRNIVGDMANHDSSTNSGTPPASSFKYPGKSSLVKHTLYKYIYT